MLFEKVSYTDGNNQLYAVGSRISKDATLAVIAEFRDIEAPGYSACNEADKLLTLLFNNRSCECGEKVYPGDHRCLNCICSQHEQAELDIP